jgi:hypothetical protein
MFEKYFLYRLAEQNNMGYNIRCFIEMLSMGTSSGEESVL